MNDPLAQVEKLLAHAKRVEGEEQSLALSLADAILDEYAAAERQRKIVAAAGEKMQRGAVLERFRALLSLAEGEGKITPAGRQLLALARSAPETPKGKFTSPQAQKFYAWHRDNAETVSSLIEKI